MSKNSPEKLLTEMLRLDPVEFIGVCKIIGVEAFEGKEPREFCDIWCDVCDTVGEMNRIRRRNLGKLIYAATKKEKK